MVAVAGSTAALEMKAEAGEVDVKGFEFGAGDDSGNVTVNDFFVLSLNGGGSGRRGVGVMINVDGLEVLA